MNDRKNITENRRRYTMAMSLGFNMVAGMVVFSALGYWIDQEHGGGQTFTLAGIFAGLFYCGYEVWKLVRKESQNNKK